MRGNTESMAIRYQIDGSRPEISDVASRVFQRKLVNGITSAFADLIGVHGKPVIRRNDRTCERSLRVRSVIDMQQMPAASDLHLIGRMCGM